MRGRSLTVALALAFGATTLAVFALVGSYLYVALDRQVRTRDDLELVLAARHARRLAEELRSPDDVRAHADRVVSTVLGNPALSLTALDDAGQVLVQHDIGQANDSGQPPASSEDAASVAHAALARMTQPVAASDRITDAAIAASRFPSRTAGVVPIRSIALYARLRDGGHVRLLVVRDMRGPLQLLDRYRDTLFYAGFAGAALALLVSYLLVRVVLRPLRDIAAHAGRVTVDRLDTRIETARAPRELAALVAALNAMLARLQGGFQRLSQFTADLAHDMRTPLANMRGATEVVLARPRSADEYQALLASNLEECDRLSRMIENVLFLARAEHPQFVTNMREFDVGAELNRIAGYFEGLADEAGSSLAVLGGARLVADLELFRRAVSNLLANALRYTPRGGRIVLEAGDADEHVSVAVTNDGPPIDAASLERIFDRFYRADPARSSQPQTHGESGAAGLGLAIVRSVMELHGGTARAESGAAGTRFVLTFPKRPAGPSA